MKIGLDKEPVLESSWDLFRRPTNNLKPPSDVEYAASRVNVVTKLKEFMAGFSDLPVEIRLTIWLLIIPDDEEEVCLLWPGHSPGSVGWGQPPLAYLPVLPLTVDTGFPLAMHICRESRAVALDPRAAAYAYAPHTSAAA